MCVVSVLLQPVEVDLFEFICEESRRRRSSVAYRSIKRRRDVAAAEPALWFDCYRRLIVAIKSPIGGRLIDARNGTLGVRGIRGLMRPSVAGRIVLGDASGTAQDHPTSGVYLRASLARSRPARDCFVYTVDISAKLSFLSTAIGLHGAAVTLWPAASPPTVQEFMMARPSTMGRGSDTKSAHELQMVFL